MWQSVLIFAHVFIAAALIFLILIQQGKGANAGAAFGAGASGTVFGARGSASFLSRASGVLATLFMATSLTLAYFQGEAGQVTGSVMQESAQQESELPVLTPAEDAVDDLPPLPDAATDSLPDLPPADTPADATEEEAPTE